MSRKDMTGKPWSGNLLGDFELAGSGSCGNGSSTAVWCLNSSSNRGARPEFHGFVVLKKRACLVCAGKLRRERGMRVVKARNTDMPRVIANECRCGYNSVDMSLVQVIYTQWFGGVSIWGGSNTTRHSDRNLGLSEALLRSFGKVKSNPSNPSKHNSHTHQPPVTTVELGLDGCLLLQLLSVMRYVHHLRHVLRSFDTH